MITKILKKHYAYKTLFNCETEFSKCVFDDLWKFCMNYNVRDSDSALIAEGRKQVIVHILNKIKMNPSRLKEINEKENNYE